MKPFLIGLTAVLLACTCFAMAWPFFPDVEPGSRQQFYGWLGVVFFTVGACAVFQHSFGRNRPKLVLSPQGFHFNTVSAEMIPWTAVTGIQNWRQRRGQIIVVKVTEETWKTAGMTRETLGARAANKLQGVDGVAVSPAGLKISFHELIRTFQAYAQAHGGQP